MSSKLLPNGNYVLIRPAKAAEQSKGGIIIPDGAKEKVTRGEILAVGPGLPRQSDGRTVAPACIAGQSVIYPAYSGTKIEQDGEELLLIREPEILATVLPD